MASDLNRRIEALRREIDEEAFVFDRRFLFRILAMGHSQFAELIGARGPNTQINSACASGTQAVSIAEDWIQQGRCKRVVIISADDVTADDLMEWIGAGFLASGAAATDERVEDAAIPFDRRRHGMLIGMGAAAVVIESADSVAERGLQPITEVLSSITANSAYHGTRLNIDHICDVMEKLISDAERKWGIDRHQIAPQTVFLSHETYTPARGGSAQAEIFALRKVFGEAADQIVIANTKGMTGHPMGVGIEDVVAIKSLETGIVPPVANFREIDPELGQLNLSRGGSYPVRYALRLGAGFGSQISMTLMSWVPSANGFRPAPNMLGYDYRISDQTTWKNWLSSIGGSGAELEVEHRTLRVRDGKLAALRQSAPARIEAQAAEKIAPPPPVSADTPPAPTDQTMLDPVQEKILEIVAEKTGYPPEMLDLELDLEADLGIDTVKQAETFAAIRAAWDIPRDDNLALRDYPTLAHAVEFVYTKRPDLARPVSAPIAAASASPTPEPIAAPATPAGDQGDPVQEKILEIVAEKTGYPSEMLDLELDLEADLGIDTVKQAETFAAIREAWDIPRDENLALRDYPTLAHAVEFVYTNRPDLARTAASPPDATSDEVPDLAQAPVAPSSAPVSDSVQEKILEIVAEKTGYPPEMLDLELDLEADLGIDTVKQAETFAAIREAWDIPRDENLALRDYPTLAHAVEFVYSKRPDLRPGGSGTEEVTEVPTEAATPAPPTAIETEAPGVNVPRRVPTPMLRPGLDLCTPTEVSLGAGSRVVVRPDRGGVGKALLKLLRKRGAEVLVLEGDDPDAVETQIRDWIDAGPIHGLFWLPALDEHSDLVEMTDEEWEVAIGTRVGLLYSTSRTLYEALEPPGSFVVAATRFGGLHGYGPEGATAPLGGAVSGFVKTLKRERPDALVKVVDFAPSRKTTAIADRLIGETLSDPGIVEVGYHNDHRWTIGLCEDDLSDPIEGLDLDSDSVFVVTGAAGSIVSAIVQDLAAASGGVFHLLDIAPAPDPENTDLARFASDREALKLELFERLRAGGERATPAQIERLLAGLERQHAALVAIQAVEKAGGEAIYHSVDLLDPTAVAEVATELRQRHERIEAVIHAAGIEISHRLPNKEPAEFDRVFDVKAKGWFHLMRSLGDLSIGAVVAFSSIAGRFGNAGQTDYSAANDLLCKLCSAFRRERPSTRGIAIDWTAWGEIGMATRGSIPQMMELAGIDMLPPQIGVPIVRRELSASENGGEIVVAGSLGGLVEEWHVSGGLDLEKISERLDGVLTGSIAGMGLYSGLRVETELDPTAQPFLYDHKIDQTPVLPGVMGLEAFAEAATLIFPGLILTSIDNVQFLAPFKFYRNEPRAVAVQAHFFADEDDVVAECRLIGSRQLATQPEPVVTEHFAGRIRLSQTRPDVLEMAWPNEPHDGQIGLEEIYKIYFHGPAYQVLERAWAENGEALGLMPEVLPANHEPAERVTVASPRILELCFQTAGLWELGSAGRFGLPAAIDRVVWHGSPEASKGRLCAVVRKGKSDGSFDASVVDEDGSVYLVLEGYRTVELPTPGSEEVLKSLRAAMRTGGRSE